MPTDKINVLLIEDTAGSRDSLTQAVKSKFAQYINIIAPEDLKALHASLSKEYDAVIADFNLDVWLQESKSFKYNNNQCYDSIDILQQMDQTYPSVDMLIFSAFLQSDTLKAKMGRLKNARIPDGNQFNPKTIEAVSPFLIDVLEKKTSFRQHGMESSITIHTQKVDSDELEYEDLPANEDLYFCHKLIGNDFSDHMWIAGKYAWKIQVDNEGSKKVSDSSTVTYKIDRNNASNQITNIEIKFMGSDVISPFRFESLADVNDRFEELKLQDPDLFKRLKVLYIVILVDYAIREYIHHPAQIDHIQNEIKKGGDLADMQSQRILYWYYARTEKLTNNEIHDKLKIWRECGFIEIRNLFTCHIIEVAGDEKTSLVEVSDLCSGEKRMMEFKNETLEENGVFVGEDTPFTYTIYESKASYGKRQSITQIDLI